MDHLECGMRVENWLLRESFEPAGDSFSAINKTLIVFGEIQHSEDPFYDGCPFKIEFWTKEKGLLTNRITNSSLSLSMNLSTDDFDVLQKQLEVSELAQSINVGFYVLLKFEETGSHNLPEATDCEIVSFTKSVLTSHNKQKQTDA